MQNECRNKRKLQKRKIKFKFEKMYKLVNKFLLHKCRNNMKIRRCKRYSIQEKNTTPVNAFLLHPVEAIGK